MSLYILSFPNINPTNIFFYKYYELIHRIYEDEQLIKLFFFLFVSGKSTYLINWTKITLMYYGKHKVF